jgi:phenylacetate-CoA ligase
VRIRYVPTSDFRPDHETVIAQRLQARMGNVKVVMEPMSEVPRGPNGKFRAVISNLSKEERNPRRVLGNSTSFPL